MAEKKDISFFLIEQQKELELLKKACAGFELGDYGVSAATSPAALVTSAYRAEQTRIPTASSTTATTSSSVPVASRSLPSTSPLSPRPSTSPRRALPQSSRSISSQLWSADNVDGGHDDVGRCSANEAAWSGRSDVVRDREQLQQRCAPGGLGSYGGAIGRNSNGRISHDDDFLRSYEEITRTSDGKTWWPTARGTSPALSPATPARRRTSSFDDIRAEEALQAEETSAKVVQLERELASAVHTLRERDQEVADLRELLEGKNKESATSVATISRLTFELSEATLKQHDLEHSMKEVAASHRLAADAAELRIQEVERTLALERQAGQRAEAAWKEKVQEVLERERVATINMASLRQDKEKEKGELEVLHCRLTAADKEYHRVHENWLASQSRVVVLLEQKETSESKLLEQQQHWHKQMMEYQQQLQMAQQKLQQQQEEQQVTFQEQRRLQQQLQEERQQQQRQIESLVSGGTTELMLRSEVRDLQEQLTVAQDRYVKMEEQAAELHRDLLAAEDGELKARVAMREVMSRQETATAVVLHPYHYQQGQQQNFHDDPHRQWRQPPPTQRGNGYERDDGSARVPEGSYGIHYTSAPRNGRNRVVEDSNSKDMGISQSAVHSSVLTPSSLAPSSDANVSGGGGGGGGASGSGGGPPRTAAAVDVAENPIDFRSSGEEEGGNSRGENLRGKASNYALSPPSLSLVAPRGGGEDLQAKIEAAKILLMRQIEIGKEEMGKATTTAPASKTHGMRKDKVIADLRSGRSSPAVVLHSADGLSRPSSPPSSSPRRRSPPRSSSPALTAHALPSASSSSPQGRYEQMRLVQHDDHDTCAARLEQLSDGDQGHARYDAFDDHDVGVKSVKSGDGGGGGGDGGGFSSDDARNGVDSPLANTSSRAKVDRARIAEASSSAFWPPQTNVRGNITHDVSGGPPAFDGYHADDGDDDIVGGDDVESASPSQKYDRRNGFDPVEEEDEVAIISREVKRQQQHEETPLHQRQQLRRKKRGAISNGDENVNGKQRQLAAIYANGDRKEQVMRVKVQQRPNTANASSSRLKKSEKGERVAATTPLNSKKEARGGGVVRHHLKVTVPLPKHLPPSPPHSHSDHPYRKATTATTAVNHHVRPPSLPPPPSHSPARSSSKVRLVSKGANEPSPPRGATVVRPRNSRYRSEIASISSSGRSMPAKDAREEPRGIGRERGREEKVPGRSCTAVTGASPGKRVASPAVRAGSTSQSAKKSAWH